MESRRTEIETGDEVVFLGRPTNTWTQLGDHGVLQEGEAYIVHYATPGQVSLAGVPGLHSKSLFQRI